MDGSGAKKHIREITRGGSKAHTLDSLLLLLMEQEEEIDKSFNHIAFLNEEAIIKASIINSLESNYSPVDESEVEAKLKTALNSIKCIDVKILRYKQELERVTNDRDSWEAYSMSLEQENKRCD